MVGWLVGWSVGPSHVLSLIGDLKCTVPAEKTLVTIQRPVLQFGWMVKGLVGWLVGRPF